MVIHAKSLDHRTLNNAIRSSDGECLIDGCCGQRFIAAGMSEKEITVHGIPGNALGAYLNGGTVTVMGNAQDAVGDTMNEGRIVIHGNVGDAAGYAMRGGSIFVKGNAGYRAGIHMKAYQEKVPVMVIGGRTGSFLGEYQGRLAAILKFLCKKMPLLVFDVYKICGSDRIILSESLEYQGKDILEFKLCSVIGKRLNCGLQPIYEFFIDHFI